MDEDDNISMRELSPSSKTSADDSNQEQGATNHMGGLPHSNGNGGKDSRFAESPFQIPPSFGCPITEETLCDNDHPYVFWALVRLPILPNPVNPMATVFDALKEFVTQLVDEDPNFVVYPYNLSAFESVKDLPPPIETSEDIPDNIDDWLEYFPGAKPRLSGGNTYMAVLIGMSKPLPKVVKILSAWMHNK